MTRRSVPRAVAALAGAALLTLAATGCSGAGAGDGGAEPTPPRLSVRDAYVPQPASADVAAGYLVVENAGSTPDRLVGVSSPAATVTLHRGEDGAMVPTDGFDVPAEGELAFERLGNHLMLSELAGPLREGDTVEMTLTFATSTPIEVEVPVTSMTYRPDGSGSAPDPAAGSSGDAGGAHSGHGSSAAGS
ncbi:copper chaperone PCu(A)C [Allostreptomyces psammosilenae]|uniref:Copper chaperone PCu(A)C n=1 Tax=Allostreptomyces psammosilenae TaxID=1892865 RepID=A0A852ZST2_9ACTN|nr:copper chaperone PCu(A)C [Allostreptomyces psammosilenae]NYI05486.1 hypothetical protein [Allostreptomyces psammosilenae]